MSESDESSLEKLLNQAVFADMSKTKICIFIREYKDLNDTQFVYLLYIPSIVKEGGVVRLVNPSMNRMIQREFLSNEELKRGFLESKKIGLDSNLDLPKLKEVWEGSYAFNFNYRNN